MIHHAGIGATRNLWNTPLSRSRATLLEYPINPIATSPIVIQVERANGPPNFSITPFHEIRIVTGTSNSRIKECLLRHCVTTSARSREFKAADVFGIVRVLYFQNSNKIFMNLSLCQ